MARQNLTARMQEQVADIIVDLLDKEPHPYSERIHKLYQTYKRLETYNSTRPYLFRIGRR